MCKARNNCTESADRALCGKLFHRDVKEEIKKRKNCACKRLMRNGTGAKKLDLSGNTSTESGAA